MKTSHCAFAIPLLVTVVGCSAGAETSTPIEDTDQVSSEAALGTNNLIIPSMRLSDRDIVAILAATNTGEIEQGQLAKLRGRTPVVQAYADKMTEDHDVANRYLQRLRIVPTTNLLSQAMMMQSALITQTLSLAPAALFDGAYVDSQIAMHTQVLLLLGTKLIPDAEDGYLRDFLLDLQRDVSEHLSLAKQIRREIL